MAGAQAMINEAAKSIGLGEPNHIQSWYRQRNGSAYGGNFAWCDAAITYWAYKSGNHKAVCPEGDRAYTVYHAQDFQKLGQWHSGTKSNVDKAKPGDIVFFDWGQTDSIGRIDHVGVVVKAIGGGRVETIEGNTSNKCLRKTRSYVDIAGYGRPKYAASAASTEEFDAVAVKDVWKQDGILASPPWIAEKGNKTWTAESYLVWLYRNQAKQTTQLTDLQKRLSAQNAAIVELVKTVTALAANTADLDADALVTNIKDAIESVKVNLVVAEDGE